MTEAISGRHWLQRARQRFVVQLSALLPELHQAVLEHLRRLREQTGTLREMQQRRDHCILFEQHSAAWQAGTQNGWRERADVLQHGLGQPAGIGPALTLEDNQAADDAVVATALAALVQAHLQTELDLLRIRVKVGQGSENLSRQDIFWLDALFGVLVQQWRLAGLPGVLWSSLHPVLQAPLQNHLQFAYADVNRFLAEHGLLPYGDRRKNGPRIVGARPNRVAAAGDGGRQAPAGMPTDSDAVWAALRAGGGTGLASAGPDAVWTARRAGGDAGLAAVGPSGAWSVPARTAFDPSMRAVAQLHQQVGLVLQQWGLMPDQPVLISTGLAQAMTHGQAQWAPIDAPVLNLAQTVAVLRNQSDTLRQAATSAAEKSVIELVALMFQSILHEERIASGLRLLFARLQIPVLRVALADPSFFSTPEHPARQLIDQIGSSILDVGADNHSVQTLTRHSQHVVDEIERCHEADPTVFERVLTDWQAFLADHLIEKELPARTALLAEQLESVQNLSAQYRRELTESLRELPVPASITAFLLQVWSEVLAHCAVKLGQQHEQTLSLKRGAADLVWAAGAKSNSFERDRVIKIMPALLRRLREGMALSELNEADIERHVKQITGTLTDAFMQRTESIDMAHIDALTQRLAGFEKLFNEQGITEMLLDADSIHLILEVDEASVTVLADDASKPSPEMLNALPGLVLGAWFELDHNAAWARVQLAWRSPRQHLFLLVSSQEHCYLVQSRRLASCLETGLLLPLENESLTARATRDAMARLGAPPVPA